MPKHISDRAKRVWVRLTDWYGSRIAEQYGTTPPPDWCETVDRSDNDTVKRALTRIRNAHADYPPTFPQFAQAFEISQSPAGVNQQTTPEQLSTFIVANRKLTERQRRLPWTYFGREFDAPDLAGKMHKNYGVEMKGVIVPADGENPGYRVTLEDMQGFS